MKTVAIILLVVVLTAWLSRFLKNDDEPVESGEESPEFSEGEYDRHYELKKEGLEAVLGPMDDVVGHAIVPFQIGGAVDMYYFSGGAGTGFATMELIDPDGSGPKPNRIGTYELVAFTKLKRPTADEVPEGDPFSKIERRMCGVLTTTGFYSYEAILNPGDTCEFPGKEGEPNRCMIFDEYAPDGKRLRIGGKDHCLLLCLKVFRSEMEHAKAHGSGPVLAKLKAAGHYPYSDLDREPVF